jgi:hypothetical protein
MAGASKYVVWRGGVTKDKYVRVRGLVGARLDDVDLTEHVRDGISAAKRWPTKVTARVDPKWKYSMFGDGVATASQIIVSSKTCALLRKEPGLDLELLPITIVDQDGGSVSTDYSVVNVLATIDCIDLAASKAEHDDPLDGGTDVITHCKKLVLREAKIGKAVMFRLEHWRSRVVIARALADKMTAAGLTTMQFLELDTYTGLT